MNFAQRVGAACITFADWFQRSSLGDFVTSIFLQIATSAAQIYLNWILLIAENEASRALGYTVWLSMCSAAVHICIHLCAWLESE